MCPEVELGTLMSLIPEEDMREGCIYAGFANGKVGVDRFCGRALLLP